MTEKIEGDIRKKKLQAKGTDNARGAESNLSFIQLANEAKEPESNRGLMVGKNLPQQVMLTQDFESCLSVHLSLFPLY